jgi:TM2 domain-containing membrane protein YozV
MIGHIESYDPETQTGVVKSEEKFYGFHLDNWMEQVEPDEGDDVRFEADDTTAMDVHLVGAYLEPLKAVKNKYIAALLALVLGPLGVHRLYLGFYRLAAIQFVITIVLVFLGLTGFAFLWSFIEFVLLIGGQMNQDAKGRPLKSPFTRSVGSGKKQHD